tara:strand:- start:219 stop:1427 length:1209 start_codon:yes stop_codon:yes gene_type:complete
LEKPFKTMINNYLPNQVDIAIIGGGMAGLSAAASLSELGIKNVSVFESNKVANSIGSSFGESRMYREMYSNPVLCRLAKESNKLWKRLEDKAGLSLRKEHGLLFYGESWEEETIEGSIPGAQKVMNEQGIPYDYLEAKDISNRFPIIPKDHFVGLFEPSAGAIHSDKAIQNWLNIVEESGNKIYENCNVDFIDESNGEIQLNGNHIVKFDQLIVASGMWSNDLLKPLGLNLDIKIWPMVWGYYLVEENFAVQYPQWFCFQRARNEDGGLYYGFPVISRNKENISRIKVGIDWSPQDLIGNSKNVMNNPYVEPLKLMLDKFIFNNLKGVIKCDEVFVSPYTMTEDVNFILDKPKTNITVFSGGSGQAFKFAPLIGKCLAERSLGKTLSFDISCWEINRVLLKN